MRKSNRPLLAVLAMLILAILTASAVWEQSALYSSAEEPTETLAPTQTPLPADAEEAEETLTAAPTSLPAEAEEPTPAETPMPDAALKGKLRVTELMEKNRACLRDEDGDFPDWIELTNVSDETISLKDVRISDREGRWGWGLPDRSLEPGERLIVFASKKDRDGAELHTSFGLSEADCVYLYDLFGRVIDRAPCGGVDDDVAMALNAAGEWKATFYPTPGYENTTAGYEARQESLVPAGPLVISETAVRNLGINVSGQSSDCDWVEIHNISDAPVRMSDYYLSDKKERPFLWQLPDADLAPGAYTIFICELPDSGFYGSTPCTGFSLNSTHEQLFLTNSDEELIDWVSLCDIPAGGSFGRMDGEAGFFYFPAGTPGKVNKDGLRRVSAMPVLLTEDGVFDDVDSVTLVLAGEGELRYTVNSSAPTEKSELYTGPITITDTCVISVRCFEEGALPSRTLALSYILNQGHTLPVVSFVAENFKEFSGIYGAGNKLYELPGSLSLYRENDRFTINCGVKLNGETSLVMTKKNLAVRFRGAYGAATLDHDIFGGGACSFTDLLLRAGQDQYQGVIRNELAQALAEKAGTAVVNQRSIWCVLYLNGQYAGVYTLKERPNASLYAAFAGVERESVEIFEAPAPFGTDFYARTVAFVNSNDMSLDENYERFCEVVDIDSLIDWLFMEGYCANTDVTSGNLRYARSDQDDGKWRLLFYDLDAAFRSFASIQTNLLNGYGASHIQVAAFSVPLMKNETFRDRFLTRAAELLSGPLTNDKVVEEIDRMADEIRPEVERDFRRYTRDPASWEKALKDLKSMIVDKDWRQANIDGICISFGLDSETREKYFGDIDNPAPKR